MQTPVETNASAMPLPMSPQEVAQRGIQQLDFVYVIGDAYIDHPSFGPAIIGRVLESRGYSVGIIAQPDWRGPEAFRRLGRSRLAFLISAGNIDSMVNHYTVAKKRRSTDAYSPGGKAGLRPDRATVVYANRCREAYRGVPVIIGGIEASLRRFAHYDYWDDRVRHGILVDAGADLLIYGMGERQILEVADALSGGLPPEQVTYVPGTCYMAPGLERVYDYETLPSFEETARSRQAYSQAFLTQYRNQDAVRGKTLVQAHGKGYLVANPPVPPLNRRELDEVYGLPYTRRAHPSYAEHIPALDEVEFSLTSCRGCYGGCAFCALTFHQGRVVQSRSHESLLTEAQRLTQLPNFKGYIHDVGGPTANYRQPACKQQLQRGACPDRQCIGWKRCPNLEVTHRDYIALLQKLRQVPGIKKVFVRSGVRYDYVMYDKDDTFLRELISHHVSGQLKVAPEHVDSRVLELMGKPDCGLYDRFVQRYEALNRRLGKEQYIVPYFMSSHPGSDLNAAIALALYLKRTGQRPEQVQDFYPTPGTLSTCMYYTGHDPRDGKPVYVARDPREKAMQRALIQYYLPQYRGLARAALKKAGRDDLIGTHRDALVPPERPQAQAPAASGKPGGNRGGRRAPAHPPKGRGKGRGKR